MAMKIKFFPAVAFVGLLLGISVSAQDAGRRQTNAASEAQSQLPNLPPNSNSLDVVANEIGLLRKSLQTLNARLREISEQRGASDSSDDGAAENKQPSIVRNLALLTQVETRAETMRRQLFELIERETALKSRQVQLEEDMRPENIERALNPIGTTRTVELRDARRRVLENERRGVDSLLIQTTQARVRLEDDLRQADALVAKLRQRLFPLIDKEIEKIQPN
jgi:hypothetical protein